MTSINILGALMLERFRAKACPGLVPGWIPVHVKKTRQNKNLEPRSDSIGTEKLQRFLSADNEIRGIEGGMQSDQLRLCKIPHEVAYAIGPVRTVGGKTG